MMRHQLRSASIFLLVVGTISSSRADPPPKLALHQNFCSPCDAPDMPQIGRDALKSAGGDAYEAVDILLPSAESGSANSQIAIAFIVNDWLNGHLHGRSREPFTWRENWVWWHFAAYKSAYMAGLLGGAYAEGAPGLRKNEKLSMCLTTRDSQPVATRVAQCFKKFGDDKRP